MSDVEKERDAIVLNALLGNIHQFTQDSQDKLTEFVAQYRKEENDYVKRARQIIGNIPTSTKKPLHSIFSRVGEKTTTPPYIYKPTPLRFTEAEKIFPIPETPVTDADFVALYNAFYQEWEQLQAQIPFETDSALFIANFTGLLERYTWCIPAGEQSDTALYDYSVLTAAVAQALFLNDSSLKEEFFFIGGDLSGIQNYLFSFKEGNLKGLSKSLRARSFYIQQVMELGARKLLKKMNLLPVARVMNAGGRFLLLAPNTIANHENFTKLRTEMENWLYETFFGDLTLSLVAVEIGAEELEESPLKALDKVNDALELSKLTRLNNVSGERQRWRLSDENWKNLQEKGVCCISGRYPAETPVKISDEEEEELICEASKICKAQLELGRDLVQFGGFFYKTEPEPKTETEQEHRYYFFQDQCLQFVREPTGTGKHQIHWLTDKKSNGTPVSAADGIRRFVANYVYKKGEKKDEKVVLFDEIKWEGLEEDAEGHLGVPHLAILKADVDNLGRIFSHGLGKSFTFPRFANMSRMLDLFFGGFLPTLLKEHFPLTYTVYAGGDDLFLIGPWKDTIDLSIKINECFKCWTCSNPKITLSAGIALIKANYPIRRGAHLAEERLEKSKASEIDHLPKNAVTVFDTTVRWEKLAELLKPSGLAEKLNDYVREDKIKTTFIHRLFAYHKMWRSLCEDANVSGALWYSRLHYDVGRNFDPENEKDAEVKKFILDELMTWKNIPYARILLSHVLYRNRRVSQNEKEDNT